MTEPILTYPDPNLPYVLFTDASKYALGLVSSTHQRNYDHIFANIPIYDESNREEFFPWLDRLEAACYYCGRDIKTEALGRSAGPVQNVIMALPHNKSWLAIREELKRCLSDQISLDILLLN